MAQSLFDRLTSKIAMTDGCWTWLGAHFKQTGYALFHMPNADGKWRSTVAHRVVYEVFVGPIPEGYQIDHLCRNRGCVKPEHLEAVTQAENLRRGMSPSAVQARQTHCKNGHEFTDENTKVRRGKRECKTCTRNYERERSVRRRAALREGVA